MLLLARRFLLRDGCAARAFACACVGMRALPPHGEAATMAQASVRADVHQALDVHLHALTQIAFDFSLRFKDGANATEFVLAQIFDARINADLRLAQNRGRTRAPDTVNVCETDLRPLVRRKIDTSYTSHFYSPKSICDF